MKRFMEHNKWYELLRDEGIFKFGIVAFGILFKSFCEYISNAIHVDLSGMPTPRPTSLYLFFIFTGFTLTYHITHTEINAWGATITTLFAIIRYGHDFAKWSMLKYSDYKKNKQQK